MNQALKGLLWCMVAAYPVLVFFGLRSLPLAYVGAGLIVVALLRLWLLGSSPERQWLPLALAALLLLIVVYTLLSGSPQGLLFYPVAVNLTLLAVFASSLLSSMPIVERLARIREPNLPIAAVAYTRKVTMVWCLFFLLNGLAALYTAVYGSFEQWAWYNGGVAYMLMGLLFSAEWLVRRRVKRVIDASAN